MLSEQNKIKEFYKVLYAFKKYAIKFYSVKSKEIPMANMLTGTKKNRHGNKKQ